MNRNRRKELCLAVGRLWLAVAYAARILLRFIHVRYALKSRFGKAWVREQLPALTLQAGIAAGATVIRSAVRPQSLQRLKHRSNRLERMLASLRKLPARQYRVTTRAGKSVYGAAAARCIQAVCGRQAREGELAQLAASDQGLVQSLIVWLENSGVGRERTVIAIVPSGAASRAQSTDGRSAQLEKSIKPTRVANESDRIAAADGIARQELYACVIEQELRHLAIPRAILKARTTVPERG